MQVCDVCVHVLGPTPPFPRPPPAHSHIPTNPQQSRQNEEVIALNALADVKLVTSIREGINLGAMEFIACQQQTRHG